MAVKKFFFLKKPFALGTFSSWLTWLWTIIQKNFQKKKKRSKIRNVAVKANTTIVLKFYFQNISSCEDTKLTLKN